MKLRSPMTKTLLLILLLAASVASVVSASQAETRTAAAAASVDDGCKRKAFKTQCHGQVNAIQRGGAKVMLGKERPPSPPLTPMQRVSRAMENYIESTMYSKERIPKSIGDAEWNGFLSGWMLVVLPIPLPIILLILCANILVLLSSKWTELIKAKYLVGFRHGAMSMAVLLFELEKMQAATTDHQVFASRIAMMGVNLAITLFFGQAGDFQITRSFMDFATFATLIYIISR